MLSTVQALALRLVLERASPSALVRARVICRQLAVRLDADDDLANPWWRHIDALCLRQGRWFGCAHQRLSFDAKRHVCHIAENVKTVWIAFDPGSSNSLRVSHVTIITFVRCFHKIFVFCARTITAYSDTLLRSYLRSHVRETKVHFPCASMSFLIESNFGIEAAIVTQFLYDLHLAINCRQIVTTPDRLRKYLFSFWKFRRRIDCSLCLNGGDTLRNQLLTINTDNLLSSNRVSDLLHMLMFGVYWSIDYRLEAIS